MSHKKRILSIAITSANTIALGASVVKSAYELRANNTKAGDLYKLVQAADESGVGTQDALANLQNHVATHMNASPLPQLGENAPVQLSKSYERAKAVESIRVTTERQKVTNDGIAICEAQYGTSNLVTRSNCIAQYGASHPVQPEKQILADLYRYDFVSPFWTPDKAGWLVLVSVVLAITLVTRLLIKLVVSFIIRR